MKSVAQEIRELADRLEKINEGHQMCPCCKTTVNECSCSASCKSCDCNHVNEDEFDMDDEGDDDANMSPGFKQDPMFDQLGKVLDSQGNPNPIKSVTTDDGKTFPVTVDQAKTLRMFATTDKVKPMVRAQFIKDIQQSETLHQFLDIKDYHAMGNLFVTKYLG